MILVSHSSSCCSYLRIAFLLCLLDWSFCYFLSESDSESYAFSSCLCLLCYLYVCVCVCVRCHLCLSVSVSAGGYISDSHLGKYQTILYFSMIYVFGSSVLALTSIGHYVWGCIVGLIFIGIGTGGKIEAWHTH